jgi:hypothetical protein
MDGNDEDFGGVEEESCGTRIMERGCKWRGGQGLEHLHREIRRLPQTPVPVPVLHGQGSKKPVYYQGSTKPAYYRNQTLSNSPSKPPSLHAGNRTGQSSNRIVDLVANDQPTLSTSSRATAAAQIRPPAHTTSGQQRHRVAHHCSQISYTSRFAHH